MFIIAIANLRSDTSSGDLSDVVSSYQRNLDVLAQALNTFGTYFPISGTHHLNAILSMTRLCFLVPGAFASRVELARG